LKKALASAWLAAIVANSALSDASLTSAAIELHAYRERAMYDALAARAAELSRDAARSHATSFWSARIDVAEAALAGEPDVIALRNDPAVLEAFAELRRRDSIRLRERSGTERTQGPTVRDDRVVLEERIVIPTFPSGIRHVRNVDLVVLTRLAPRFDQVPDLYEAYGRAVAPVPLPDFLGALAVLLARHVLSFD
jgi:hypothetical protein